MNTLFYFIIIIFQVNGYCENFCLYSYCDELNGNYFSECSDCPMIYKCNAFLLELFCSKFEYLSI